MKFNKFLAAVTCHHLSIGTIASQNASEYRKSLKEREGKTSQIVEHLQASQDLHTDKEKTRC